MTTEPISLSLYNIEKLKKKKSKKRKGVLGLLSCYLPPLSLSLLLSLCLHCALSLSLSLKLAPTCFNQLCCQVGRKKGEEKRRQIKERNNSTWKAAKFWCVLISFSSIFSLLQNCFYLILSPSEIYQKFNLLCFFLFSVTSFIFFKMWFYILF